MDQPTSIAAIVVGLAAGVIATAEPPISRQAQAADSAVAAAPVAQPASAACVKRAPGPNIAPPAATQQNRPPDLQQDTRGLNAAGGVGSLPSDVRGDPCAAVVRPQQITRPQDHAPSSPR